MRLAHLFLGVSSTLGSMAAGQQSPNSRVKVLTVCEVLGGVDRYADATVAVVGRMKYSVGLIDHYEFLSQDGCGRPIITHRHVWSNEIQVWSFQEPGMPTPPMDKPKLDAAEIVAKL